MYQLLTYWNKLRARKRPSRKDTNINSAAVALGHSGDFKGYKARDNSLLLNCENRLLKKQLALEGVRSQNKRI
jgi:hypothetical protein